MDRHRSTFSSEQRLRAAGIGAIVQIRRWSFRPTDFSPTDFSTHLVQFRSRPARGVERGSWPGCAWQVIANGRTVLVKRVVAVGLVTLASVAPSQGQSFGR